MKMDFKLSVITPVYNAEKYLEESISCILDQTIGFEQNIQLILVNDGSSDDSSVICRKYQALFPDNVFYIEKENGGVSSARNAGLEQVKGKYTVFLDADDRWDLSALMRIYEFFESNPDTFDVCTCRLMFIGDYSGKPHPLDYKYEKGDRIVDLTAEPTIVCLMIGNSAFRSSAIRDIRFNPLIAYGEDSDFVNTVLLNNLTLGVLSNAVYYYRKDYEGTSASSSAPNKKSWYLDIPNDYYLELCNKSLSKYGKTLPYIQQVILYDMRRRHYNPAMMDVLDDNEKQHHVELMHTVFTHIGLKAILHCKGYTPFRRLYFLDLKYGKSVILASTRKKTQFIFKNTTVFSLEAPQVLRIRVFSISNDNILTIEGITRLSALKRDYKLILVDNSKNEYPLDCEHFERGDIRGYVGEDVAKAERFRIDLPIHPGLRIYFCTEIEGRRIRLVPSYDVYIGMFKGQENNYCVKNGFIIKQRASQISFYKDSLPTRIASETRLAREMIKKKGFSWETERLKRLRLTHIVEDSRLRNKVAFVTTRSDGELQGNMAEVYARLDLPKVKFAKRDLSKNIDDVITAAKMIYTSRIVVTDDYLTLFRSNTKRSGQKYIQLWHAAGAGKKFGQDGTSMFPGTDLQYHRDYDIVTVSGEAVREQYASAFGIPMDRVIACGIARTDVFFDDRYKETARNRILTRYPQLRNRQIILYTPTFRDLPGVPRTHFLPALDFRTLSASLREDQIFVLCPHPEMTAPIITEDFENILEIRDVNTNDMMLLSDIMITDYSATMFEYALLNKPMAFFCYDYEDYDRGFYMDYDSELPGPLLKTQSELISYLQRRDYPLSEKLGDFCQKYLSACDGHSTDRIIKLIESMYHEK